MCEPQLKEVDEGVASVALHAQVEVVRGMQDELIGTSCLALDDAREHLNAELLPQLWIFIR